MTTKASCSTRSSRRSRPCIPSTSSGPSAGFCSCWARSSWPTTSGAPSAATWRSRRRLPPVSRRSGPRNRGTAMAFRHETIEKNSLLLLLGILVAVSIGGLVEMVPLFTIGQTIEDVKGIRPYSPLELAGRNIYIREGCYVCNSQQIRTFRDEVDRYGHYSIAAESKYDHPFQWGSKRTGPDLARVGGKYSNDWHVAHLIDPRSVVPGSVMPSYPFLAEH